MPPADSSTPQDAWHVICLCAQWCGACREWRPVFGQLAADHPGLRFSWIDIEDEADALGEVDIETFPTLLIARGAQPLFYGPVQPSQSQVSRLVASLQADPAAAARAAPEAAALLDRISRM